MDSTRNVKIDVPDSVGARDLLPIKRGTMTPFELLYLQIQPFYLPLHRRVRRELLRIVKNYRKPCEILDVGGRKSHYTIGIPGTITISDLPRETEIQRQLHLGITQGIIEKTKGRRTNLRAIVYDDMTKSALPSETFDCVVAVEVLEHVEADLQFVKEVERVLTPGGVFLMTTPNGDYVKNNNPDHKRHYTRQQLFELLSSSLSEVQVNYAIKGGVFHRLGLKGWSLKRPITTLLSMVGNLINSLQSGRKGIKHQAIGTHHLIAVAHKPKFSEAKYRMQAQGQTGRGILPCVE